MTNSFLSLVQLSILIKRERPDVVHSNTAVILTAGLASRLSRTPHVWHIRESFHEFGRLWPLYRRYIELCSDRVVCVSKAITEQFGARNHKVVTINNGFPASEFGAPDRAAIQQFRDANGLEDRDLVSVIGRIKLGRKGQDTFVRAASILKDRYPDARFVCVGTSYPDNAAHTTALEDLIHALDLEGHVVLLGELDDPRPAIAASDIVVLPSGTPEPFAGIVIEAMALARPVVGTDTGGTPEQIDHGNTGLLVPPNDAVTLAAALELLLDDTELRAAMGSAGRTRFAQRFEFEPFYRQMLALYQELAADP